MSLISLAVLSYERYCTMMCPTEPDVTNYRKVAVGVVLSWVYSLVWTLPPFFGWSRYGLEGPGITCSVDWTTKTANNISYIVSLFIFCLVLPFLVIVCSYGKLLHAVKQVRRHVLFGSKSSAGYTGRGFTLYPREGFEVIPSKPKSKRLDSQISEDGLTRVYILYSSLTKIRV